MDLDFDAVDDRTHLMMGDTSQFFTSLMTDEANGERDGYLKFEDKSNLNFSRFVLVFPHSSNCSHGKMKRSSPYRMLRDSPAMKKF